MKLSKKLVDKINEQLNYEQESAFIYLSMMYEFQSRSLEGFAGWMKAQHNEEIAHAAEMAGFLLERGVRPLQQTIAEVPNKFGTVLEIFEDALKHEEEVSKRIRAIVDLAIEEKDYNAENFFRKYIDEQAEEESTFAGIIDKLKLSGDAGILFMDHGMGKRQ